MADATLWMEAWSLAAAFDLELFLKTPVRLVEDDEEAEGPGFPTLALRVRPRPASGGESERAVTSASC